jgi:hypothetical protein
VKLYEPLNNLEFNKIIPSEDKILYSAKLNAQFEHKNLKYSWYSHVVLTDKGVALCGEEWAENFFPVQKLCGIRLGNYFYVPWHAVSLPKTDYYGLIFREPSKRGSEYGLSIIKKYNPEVPVEQRKSELYNLTKILIEKNKAQLYNLLLPILKTYPKGQEPKKNPSTLWMLKNMYKELSAKIIKELRKQEKKGTFHYREEIKPIPRDTYYDKEIMITKLSNFEYINGTYETIKKIEEMVIVFTNFFKLNSINESAEILVKIYEIHPEFFIKWFPEVREYIVRNLPNSEQNLFNMENLLLEKTVFNQVLKPDEYIIDHFKGVILIPKYLYESPGHIWITNYRLIEHNWTSNFSEFEIKVRTWYIPIDLIPAPFKFFTGLGLGLLFRALNKMSQSTLKTKAEFLKILTLNPEIFFFKNPYNLKIDATSNIRYTVNVNYDPGMLKLDIVLKINIYKGEEPTFFKQRKERIYSKLQDLFSNLS